MSKDMTVRGVGGWLYFLIIVLTILGPLVGLGRLASEIQNTETQMPDLVSIPVWDQYKSALWIVTFAAAVLHVVAGYRLAKFHVWKSVRFAVFALWCAGPGTAIPILLAAWLFFGLAGAIEMIGELLVGVFQGAIAATVWSTYLLVSVRVRNTYSDVRLPTVELTARSAKVGPDA